MRKSVRVISIALVVCIVCTSAGFTSFAVNGEEEILRAGTTQRFLDKFVDRILNAFSSILPENDKFYDIDDYEDDYFYSGSGEFVSEPLPNAQWMLGSSETSLVPEDWQEHDYLLGGYFNLLNGLYNKVERIYSDMRVRTVAISDGPDRGVTLFAVIDSIGTTNQDIREIRERFEEKNNGDYKISAINIASTHSHSGIDTQGLWTKIIRKIAKNLIKALLRIGKLETGTDPKYMEFLYEKVSDTLLEACRDMEAGTMTFAKKDIGDDYFKFKERTSFSSIDSNMYRFIFTPFNEKSRPTMIVNMAAHPDVAGLATNDEINILKVVDTGRVLSGEYIYHMGEVINGAGYDFLFLNGAIAAIYMDTGTSENHQNLPERPAKSERYGNELGKMALSMTFTEQQIFDDEYLSSREVEAREREITEENEKKENAKRKLLGKTLRKLLDKDFVDYEYRIWYEGWTPVDEVTLEPILNIALKEIDIPVKNGFIKVVGKLNLANYDILKDGKEYCIRTEIGIMEIGSVKIALMPGEICQDLVYGGTSIEAETSFWGEDFSKKTVAELLGDDVIVFGLMNDAIGYVVPDNDYYMCRYHELINIGKVTASTIMAGFEELVKEIR